MNLVFPAPPMVTVGVTGARTRFAVRRIYCVGRNYAAHAREMGRDPGRDPPFFFMKPADSIVSNHSTVPYPPRTSNFHHEIELVAAIGRAGCNISVDRALEHVWGYGVGNDLTRRDLQLAARDQGRPWETGKAFDRSAVLTALTPASVCGHPDKGRIWLNVNGVNRQQADISDLIWSVPEVVAELSTLFELEPGDVVFTGTPAGVGPLVPGDQLLGGIDGLDELSMTVGSAS